MVKLPSINGLIGIELEQFFHRPGTPQTMTPTLLGIAVDGCRGRYNQFGNQTEVLKTIPYSNNEYNFEVQEPDVNKFTGSVNTVNVAFVDRTNLTMNPPLMIFSDYYLLVLNIYTV